VPEKPSSSSPLAAIAVTLVAAAVGAVLGALVLGGAGRESAESRGAREAAAASTSTPASAADVSQLGKAAAAPLSPYRQLLQDLVRRRTEAYAVEFRGMDSQQRRVRIIDFARTLSDNPFSMDAQSLMETQLHLRAMVQPEDIVPLLQVLQEGKTGLSMEQARGLQAILYANAAKGDGNAVLDSLRDSGIKDQTLKEVRASILQEKARSDPFGALELLRLEEYSSLAEGYDSGSYYERAAQLDTPRALKMALKAPGGFEARERALSAVLFTVATKEGYEKAIEMTKSITALGSRAEVQSEIIGNFAQFQPQRRQEILGYLKNAPDLSPDVRKGMESKVFDAWSWQDPAGFLTWGLAHEKEYTLDNSLQNAVRQLSNNDPALGLRKVLELDAEKRKSFLPAVYASLSRADPALAVKELDKLSPTEVSAVRPRVVDGWAQRNPAEAAKFVEAHGNGPDRAEMLQHLTTNWLDIDQRAASEWLAAQPVEPARDDAVQALISKVQQQDPEAAVLWSLQVSDAGRQKSSIDASLATWAKRDPGSATNWVNAQTTVAGAEETKRRLEVVEMARVKK
jgi:hypothetical protein